MKPRRPPAPRPWWSEPGPTACEFCSGTFNVEVGYYCADCDRAICPVCVLAVREHRTVICPDCHAEAEA